MSDFVEVHFPDGQINVVRREKPAENVEWGPNRLVLERFSQPLGESALGSNIVEVHFPDGSVNTVRRDVASAEG